MTSPMIEDGNAWAVALLRSHRMPDDEIRVLMTTEDPDLIRRYLELHEERLEEELADRRRAVRLLEQHLVRRIRQPPGVRSGSGGRGSSGRSGP